MLAQAGGARRSPEACECQKLATGHLRYFCLGGNRAAGNRGIDFGYMYNGQWGREKSNWKWRSYSSNRWYSLKVEVRGDMYRAHLDGLLVLQR